MAGCRRDVPIKRAGSNPYFGMSEEVGVYMCSSKQKVRRSKDYGHPINGPVKWGPFDKNFETYWDYWRLLD